MGAYFAVFHQTFNKWEVLKNINDANNEEYCDVMLEDIDEILETTRIEEEPPIDDEIHLTLTFVEFESATT